MRSINRINDLLERWSGVYLNDRGLVIGYRGLAISEMNPLGSRPIT